MPALTRLHYQQSLFIVLFPTQCQCNTKGRYGEAHLWYESQAENGYAAEKVEEAENYESCVEEPNQRYVGDDRTDTTFMTYTEAAINLESS